MGIDYDFTEVNLDSEWVNAVKLLDGPYKDVVYYYGRVGVTPEEDGPPRLSYEYRIYDIPSSVDSETLKSDTFKTVVGDVLVSIITTNGEQGEYATVRDHYSKESDL